MRPVSAFGDPADALADALHCAEVASRMPDPSALRLWRRHNLGVRGRLREARRLLAYVDDQLRAALRLDDEKQSRALATLRAYVEADGVMTDFASRIGTSRPSAYARLRWLSGCCAPRT